MNNSFVMRTAFDSLEECFCTSRDTFGAVRLRKEFGVLALFNHIEMGHELRSGYFTHHF